MNLKKIWLILLCLSGFLVSLLTLTPGKVYAGGLNSDGVYGDLQHKTKKPKPTLFVRTATPTQTLTPTITTTPTSTTTLTHTTTLEPTEKPSTPTKTEIPLSVDDAEAIVAPPIIVSPFVIPVCGSPAAILLGFAGITWMNLRKRNDEI